MASFDHHAIPHENIIGFGSDGCSTMLGCRNSVASRFRDHFPGVIISKCLSHSLALCASEACKTLPRICEDLIRNIYDYFSRSSKRQCQFSQFQYFLDIDMHKLLHPVQTRWLSVRCAIDRVIEQWEALRMYFDYESLHERVKTAEDISANLSSPFVKAYYLFLQWVLPKFTDLNKYFQADNVVITKVHAKMVFGFKDLLFSFLQREHVSRTRLRDMKLKDSSKYLPLPNLYLGVAVMRQLENEEIKRQPDLILDFKMRCREFLVTGCAELQSRYDFEDPVLSAIFILAPEKALSHAERRESPSIVPLATIVPRICPADDSNLQKLDDEWRQLPLMEFPESITKETEVDVFWHKVLHFKDSMGESYFSTLATFALGCLSVPHSNAQCERIFSKVNLTKTKTRNRLITPTIIGALLTSELIKSQEDCCTNSEVTRPMIDRMSAANLYRKRAERTGAEREHQIAEEGDEYYIPEEF